MEFELNCRGGWIIPPATKLPDRTRIVAFSDIGKGCTIGKGSTVGRGSEIGPNTLFENLCRVHDSCILGTGITMGNACEIDTKCIIRGLLTTGERCVIGKGVIGLSKQNVFGVGTTFWYHGTKVEVLPKGDKHVS